MSGPRDTIPVLAAPMIDAGAGRIDMTMPVGSNVEEIVCAALPALSASDRRRCRVMLVSERGSVLVAAEWWSRVKPHAGVRVVIRLVPGKDALRSILQVVISIAAIAIGQFYALPLAGALGVSTQVAAGIIGLGVTVIGNLLINALIPPVKPDQLSQQNRYQLSGLRNRMDPDGAVPLLLGRLRYAPPFATYSYTEIVGDWQYIRAAFCVGYGDCTISDLWIGDTPITDYDEVQAETRPGVAGDAPLSLITRQVIEETVGAELVMAYPRDDLGEIIDGSVAVQKRVIRTTGADAAGASVIIAWPAGMVSYDKKGRAQSASVTIRIEQRLVTGATLGDDEGWSVVETITVQARKLEAFFRQHSWTFPSRGRWQVAVTMQTPESTSSQVQQRTSWAVLQTIRPEYPLNFPHPLALIAVRIKATHQLTGQLDNLSAVVSRRCLDYDHTSGTWIVRETSNPASLYRYVLQSPANPRPVSDAGIDLAALADWHDFCRLKGLKSDIVYEETSSQLRDVLAEIAGAGRASPRHDGLRWTVTVDRPDKPIVDHFSPRNSYDFSVTRSYVEPPDAFRVQFRDAANDYKAAERIVPWPGKESAELLLTEELKLPGKTDAAEIYREARRRMYEAIYRPDVFSSSRDGAIQVATRGDRIRLASDIIDRVQVATRVRSVSGRLIELDEPVAMADGEAYALRFRAGLTEEDTIGTSVLRAVATRPGAHSTIVVTGDGAMPAPGDIIHFGRSSKVDYDLLVTAVEAGEDMSSHYRLVALASVIDEMTDADVIPAWSGRAGAEIPGSAVAPTVPRIASVRTGTSGTGVADAIDVLVEPGAGVVAAARYDIDHRLTGATAWATLTVSAAAGGGRIMEYPQGASVDLRVRAVSAGGTPSGYSAIVVVSIGSGDVAIPASLPADMITIGALLGGAVVQFSTADDAAVSAVQIFVSTSATLDRETAAYGDPLAVSASRSYSAPIGDVTRSTLLTDTAWTAGTGWSVSGGVATHTPGSAGSLSQPVTLSAGLAYRLSYRVASRTAGTVTPRLTGGTVVSGAAASANGIQSVRLIAASGNNGFELSASSAFNGVIDQIALFQETTTCLAAGTHYIWLEPLNSDGIAGPLTGPIAVTVR